MVGCALGAVTCPRGMRPLLPGKVFELYKGLGQLEFAVNSHKQCNKFPFLITEQGLKLFNISERLVSEWETCDNPAVGRGWGARTNSYYQPAACM
jgi:hypothetical protein